MSKILEFSKKALSYVMVLAVCYGLTDYQIQNTNKKYDELAEQNVNHNAVSLEIKNKLDELESQLSAAKLDVLSSHKKLTSQKELNSNIVDRINKIGSEINQIVENSAKNNIYILDQINRLQLNYIELQASYINKTNDYLTPEELRNKLLIPSVKISVWVTRTYDITKDGKVDKKEVDMLSSTGSGTVVYSEKIKQSYDTYILTCSHLIDYMDSRDKLKEIKITFFDYYGSSFDENAAIITNTDSITGKDIMLLKLNSSKRFKSVDIMSREDFKQINIFDKVYNVGAGTGLRPYPSAGEITGLYTEYSGLEFLWQISTPSVPGNSGCGIFDAKTGELIGVLVRGGVYRGSLVYHQTLMVPVTVIRDYFAGENIDLGLK